MTTRWVSALMLCVLAVRARGAHGQTIHGTVRGAQTSASIGLALVRAIEVRTGREIARALTDASGNFTLGAVAGEEFVLELRRVGIRRTTSAPMRLATGEVARPEIVVDEVVLPLGRVAVKTKSACGSDAERSVDVARLLDEIRTAVGVAELAASTLATDASVRLFRRVMDPQSGAIQSDSLSTLPGRYRWPFLGPSPQLLATSGYARTNDDGGITFFAPDPRVLASAEFLETHCFSVTHKPTDSTRVGLSFRPLRGHRSTDVEGTVWIDRSTAEPRELEARYVRTPRSEYEARATATVRFARLADGRWIVASWAIRSPVMTIARRPGGRVGAIRSPADERVEIVAMQEEGGFVEFGDGRFSPLGAITIETRTEGAPAGEVTLLLSGVGRRIKVARDASASVRDLAPGRYTLLAYSSDPLSAETKLTRAEADVMAGRSTALRLDWRTAIGSASSLCPTAKRANAATALLIVFIDSASGGLARNATARLRATLDQLVDASRIRSSVNNRAISAAPVGWFIDCDRRPGERVELQFPSGRRRVDVQLGRLGDRPIELREVVVPVLDPKQ